MLDRFVVWEEPMLDRMVGVGEGKVFSFLDCAEIKEEKENDTRKRDKKTALLTMVHFP